MRTAGRNAHLVLGACLAVFAGGGGREHPIERGRRRERKRERKKEGKHKGGMDAIEGDLMCRDVEAAVERDLSEKTRKDQRSSESWICWICRVVGAGTHGLGPMPVYGSPTYRAAIA